MATAKDTRIYSFLTEGYLKQNKQWPKEGRHILAQFDEDTVLVYQAYRPSIAQYAVENQRFGGPDFSFDRMSWIKTNFLWMMYRCGWASKKNQEHVLAVRITRKGFEEILANAYTAWFQKSHQVLTKDIQVRLQWDPDHSPGDNKLPRKAIQLGMKGEMLQKYAQQFIVHIDDITEFVKEQGQILKKTGTEDLLVAKETIYPLTNQAIVQRIGLDFYEADTQARTTVVRGFQTQKPESKAGAKSNSKEEVDKSVTEGNEAKSTSRDISSGAACENSESTLKDISQT